MKYKTHVFPYAVVGISMIMDLAAFAVASDLPDSGCRRLAEEKQRIQEFAETGDVAGLEQKLRLEHDQWMQLPREEYAWLMRVTVETLENRFEKNREEAHALMLQYARAALDRADGLPLDDAVAIVVNLMDIPESDDEQVRAGFAVRRREDTERWLRVWQQLDNALDPAWDPNDEPLLNVPPPLGADILPGQAPEDIDDPDLREQYRAAIAENTRKAERYRQQRIVRDLRRRYMRVAVPYLVKVYAEQPLRMEELQDLLEAFVRDRDARENVVETLEYLNSLPEEERMPALQRFVVTWWRDQANK